MKKKDIRKKETKGLNAKITNAILILAGCVLTFLILVASIKVKQTYDSITYAMNDYSECSKALNDFRNASLYLTNQARLYSINYNTTFVDNYFYEKNNLQRREVAIQIIELTHENDSTIVNMKQAYRESQFLERIEYYAMRLVSEASNIPFTELPTEIQDVQLIPEDVVLSPIEKYNKAREILFDTSYITAVDKISYYCNSVASSLLVGYLNNQSLGDLSIQHYFKVQFLFVITLLILIISLYVLLIVLILIPLSNNCRLIEKGRKMRVVGCSEVRSISKIYNTLYDKNVHTASELKHNAEHDALTGVINRRGFFHIRDILKTLEEPIAYLIVDIDLFKQVNDTYGHLVGDEVLKKIASILSEQFRNSDYVARVGGDEFAIIMTKIGADPTAIIQKKIESINQQLQNVSENLPKVSLSVGVSFSESGYKRELEEQADKALYKVKRGGRCNCSFYNPDNE